MGGRTNLYEAIRPIRVLLCFYGFNVDHRVPKLIVWVGKISSLISLLIFTCCFYRHVKNKIKLAKINCAPQLYDMTEGTIELTWFANIWFYLFAFAKRKSLEQLILALKGFSIANNELFKIRVYFASAIISTCLPFIFRIAITYSFTESDISSAFAEILVNWMPRLYLCCYVPLLSLAYALTLFHSSSIEELMEGVKRSHSSSRRARLTTRLITHYYRVREVATHADTLFSTPLYWLKTTTLLFMSCTVMAFKFVPKRSVRSLTDYKGSYGPICAESLVLGVVLVSMIKANKMVSRVFKCLTCCEMSEAEINKSGRSIKMRVDVLTQLAHLRMDQAPFTLAGEPLQGDFYYSMCIETNDMVNYMHDHSKHFALSRKPRPGPGNLRL